jgi:hypothetical protein
MQIRTLLSALCCSLACSAAPLFAHEGPHGHAPIHVPLEVLASPASLELVQDKAPRNLPYDAFAPSVTTRRDERWLYVESQGWPAHPMMAGILTWQQQVPLPQPYSGDNAWRIPLQPKLADKPIRGKTALLRGAIALAANGVPIFNALNNRGEDAYKIGELDRWGGHCGRSDDYHYHVAPLHLLEKLGADSPLGHALDGFPLYGLFDPKQPKTCPLGGTAALDEINGHLGKGGEYHYHSSLEYPYINGGVRGVVVVEGDQIDPQPRAAGVRPALQALRGAAITKHESRGEQSWSLSYTLNGGTHRVDYQKLRDGRWQFDFVAADGTKTSETYPAQNSGGGRGNGGGQGGGERRREPRGPQPGEQPDLPWILAHAAELDTDQDGAVTRAELLQQAKDAFMAFDADKSGSISEQERRVRAPRLPMGGFVGLHVQELDADSDGTITLAEMEATSVRMFGKSDTKGDGKLAGEERTRPSPGGGQGGGQGRRNQPREQEDFHDEVPAHPWDIVLARPGATEMTISVLSYSRVEGRIEYGIDGETSTQATPSAQLELERAQAFVLTGLKPDTAYSYRWQRRSEKDTWESSETYRFHTQRPPGTPYTFTIIADSHLDSNAQTATLEQTLANALSDRPDFHVDLGDTFMTDKRRHFADARPQYFAQRYWQGKLGHSVPLFMILGNHDGEYGYNDSGPDGMSQWSHRLRTNLFPAPVNGGIYSGNQQKHPVLGELQDYYAWTWGDATHIVLDPFWYTTVRGRGNGPSEDNWSRTLGKAQVDWLSATLAACKSKYIFVYIHHLVGGRGRDARGGVESAGWYEWGGRNEAGVDEFAVKRPGWPKPIHQLLVEHKVAAVFHGHDHMYVHNQLDGVVYQLVPQPGNTRGGTGSAEPYGYTSGLILGSPGHLRVRVGPNSAQVEFVRSASGAGRRGEGARLGAELAHRWEVKPRSEK